MTEQSDTRLDGSSLLRAQMRETEEALIKLGASDPELAATLARVLGVVASEAARTARFARALGKALAPPGPQTAPRPAERPRRSRRAPGVIEPFAVFAESGEAGLRSCLGELDLEQLRDIISEHGMDHDRLAMKWKDPQRVIDRIVERVESRTAKGAAFRGRPEQSMTPHGEAGDPKPEDPPA
ncbi:MULTISPECIES: hypothetical protein [unclassified Streptomyces]|uniref:hypothetical protein n=1 Tax=unclassified Streptomyces TaxID=2593676 RepID=UPI001C248F6F|nr:hypothetical protein [Streptomyces sp. AC558_RSS880]